MFPPLHSPRGSVFYLTKPFSPQYAFEEAEEGEEEEGGEQTYIDDSDDSGDIDAKIIQGWESDKMSSPVPTTDVGSEIDRGAMQDCVGAHR